MVKPLENKQPLSSSCCHRTYGDTCRTESKIGDVRKSKVSAELMSFRKMEATRPQSSSSAAAESRRKLVLENISTMDQFYDQVTAHLKLEDWFGRNLDALNDVLRGGCGKVEPRGTTFVWQGSAASKIAIGSKFDDVVEIFGDHAVGGEEENDIILILE